MIASRTAAYLRDSIRAVNARLTESVEKTLSGLFAPSTSSVPNLDLFPVMLFFMRSAIGADAGEKRGIEQVPAATRTSVQHYSLLVCGVTPEFGPGRTVASTGAALIFVATIFLSSWVRISVMSNRWGSARAW